MINLGNLKKRILSGIVFVGILIFGIIINQYVFFCVFSIILVLCLHEFYDLLNKNDNTPVITILNIVGGLLLFGASFLYFSAIVNSLIVFVPFILYLLFVFISELYAKHPKPVKSIAYSILGQVYLSLPFSLLFYLVFHTEPKILSYHHAYILALFLFIWINDTFAFLFGSMLGKRKMFERISPKKTWEGFIGGAVCTILASIVYANFFTGIPLSWWMGVAIVQIVFGTFGDLVESLFKRSLNVKDSGSIIPGHGGILDRFDSFILAVPAQFVYLQIFNYLY